VVKCPNCSGENADTQHFCGECGTPLPAAVPQPQSSPAGDETVRLPSAELLGGAIFAKRYRVIEELGTGGMGRVYRVLDRKLDEEIALKLVRPEIASDRATIERFSAELKLARQVVHKNVARMFDLNEEGGVPYITMEYVQGENLKRLIRKVGRLFAGQAIPIACQISEGLAEAHRLGIVHRDLKPQNIMIDEDGQAKIMDFGLARLLKTDDRTGKEGTEGTPAYISPEQAKGLAPDARSDLYSLGVLMYEMLTGGVPFKGASTREVVQKHLTEPPRDPYTLNPGISTGLSQIVMKCLEKNPGARFQTAQEVREALERLPTPAHVGEPEKAPGPGPSSPWRRLARAAVPAVVLALAGYGVYRLIIVPPVSTSQTSTIAVLPVTDISPNALHTDLGRPVQEAIATGLSGVPNLTVVPPLTVDAIDTAGKDSRTIARLLNADYLLQLSLRDEPAALHLKAVLINAAGGRGRLARTYDLVRAAGDRAAAKDEFSKDISLILPGDIVEDRRHKDPKGISANLDARVLYHEGMRLIEDVYPGERSDEVFEEAVGKYREALDLDPDYALALWALGNAYEARYNNTDPDRRDPEDLERMCGYYLDAFKKNPDSSETNIGLGWAHFNKSDFPMAFRFFKNAIELEPRSAVVNLDVGAFLRSIGLYDRAMRYLSRAAELAPHDTDPLVQLSQCLMAMGRFEESAKKTETAISLDPNDVEARYLHVIQIILAGRLSEAEKEIAALRGTVPAVRYLTTAEALLAAAKGEKDKALSLKGDSETLPIQGTCFYILLGMTDEAVSNIEAGIEKGFKLRGDYLYSYPSLVKNPSLKSLRGIPRFEEILKRQKERYTRELKKFEKI
jgi:serine/threonine protein kinase/tetratricopeptide (TPR) repeat protein